MKDEGIAQAIETMKARRDGAIRRRVKDEGIAQAIETGCRIAEQRGYPNV